MLSSFASIKTMLRATAPGGLSMRAFLLAVLAFLLTIVATWIVVMGIYILATSLGWAFDRDGGMAMGAAFVIGPGLGLMLGLVAAVVVGVRSRRKTHGS